MDDSQGTHGLQGIADYIDRYLKLLQIGENAPKKHDRALENLLHVYRNDPEMYRRLQDVYQHGYSNILNPDPSVKRWM